MSELFTGMAIPFDLALLAMLGVALVVLLLAYRKLGARGGASKCGWRRADRRGSSLQKWVCRSCGAEAYSTDRRPPKECKRSLKIGI